MTKTRDIIGKALLLLLVATFASCTTDALLPEDGAGSLRLSLSEISTAVTRSTPEQLGAPTVADFHLTVTTATGRNVYDGAFTNDEITLPAATYTVTATCGDNPVVGVDAPYYVATATATVTEGQTTDVSLEAKVGNALVSAIFGVDAEERARFERYYSDYSLYVNVGQQGIAITRDEPAKSVYVQAGSNVTLRFWGKLKMENGREVSKILTSPDLPSAFSAADHTIVTLTLPDPESAVTVAISKVETEPVTLDETIPLSWLPIAMVVPMHQYDEDGTLMGTNLIITESYPGVKWKAVITNAAGTTVRAIEGTGALSSEWFNNRDAWPYLPQGEYKASYYLFDDDDNTTLIGSRDFTIEAPAISMKATGYTSFSKYLEGSIDVANLCDRLTVYEPKVTLNVSKALLQNDKYSYTFSYTYDGTTANVPVGLNAYNLGNMTDQAVQVAPHVLRGDATFDGVSVTDKINLYITGLPYSLNLQSHDEWTSSGGVDWFDNDVRLGHLSTGSQYIQTTSSVCIPSSTYFCAEYSVNVHTLTVGTYFSIKAGNNEILKIEEGGTPFRDTDHMHSGTTAACHDDNAYITSIRCYNDYGAGQTCSHIYSLTFKYANH